MVRRRALCELAPDSLLIPRLSIHTPVLSAPAQTNGPAGRLRAVSMGRRHSDEGSHKLCPNEAAGQYIGG